MHAHTQALRKHNVTDPDNECKAQPRDLTREGSLGLRVGEWGAACRSGVLEAAKDTCQRGLQGSRCRQTWPSRSAQGVPPPCWETAFFTAHPALLLKEAAAYCLPVFPPDTGALGSSPKVTLCRCPHPRRATPEPPAGCQDASPGNSQQPRGLQRAWRAPHLGSSPPGVGDRGSSPGMRPVPRPFPPPIRPPHHSYRVCI